MKKVLLVFLCATMTFMLCFAQGQNMSSLDNIRELEALDVVRTPLEKFEPDSNISRRDMFKMIYIVVNASFVAKVVEASPRQFFVHPDADKNMLECEGLQDCLNNFRYFEEEREKYILQYGKEYCYYDFADVEYGSQDHLLAYSLMQYRLLRGVEREGALYAEFDRPATYSEALTALSYMFLPNLINGYTGGNFSTPNIVDENGYMGIAEQYGIIDDVSVLEKSNTPVSAYEFMSMLYNAINKPFELRFGETVSGDSVYPSYRYIDGLKNAYKNQYRGEAITD